MKEVASDKHEIQFLEKDQTPKDNDRPLMELEETDLDASPDASEKSLSKIAKS